MNLVLDTNALLWMSQGNSRLGPETRAAIDTARRDSSLGFASISMLEVARLHHIGRLDLRRTPEVWHRELLNVGVREIPITSEIAILAASLEPQRGFHSDPADQLVTATAIATRRNLVTSDRMILAWAAADSAVKCLDART